MSTLTDARPSPEIAAVRPRLVSGVLVLVFLASFGTLTSFYLLFAVFPMYAAAAGAGTAGAGLVTGVLLLGTVAAELASAGLMKRYGYLPALVAGAVLLGVPTLALLASGSLAIMGAVSFVRGFGFGLSAVVAGALAAELLPPERRGEGLGLYGAVDSAPAIVALPAGIWLANHYGFALVVVIAAAAALAPVVAFPWLRRKAHRLGSAAAAGSGQSAGLRAGLRDRAQLRLALIFATSTVAAGVVASFLPLARGMSANIAAIGLLAQALTATISRWWAGRHGDRHGHARLLVPGLVMAALGMIAMLALTFAVAVIAGMCVFGIGFGIVQNATLALMMERVPASGIGTASAIWNLADDVGYGAGPAAFGLFVAHTGYPAGLALTGLLMIAVLPSARIGRRQFRRPASPSCSPSSVLGYEPVRKVDC
jgi:MFS family permease